MVHKNIINEIIQFKIQPEAFLIVPKTIEQFITDELNY